MASNKLSNRPAQHSKKQSQSRQPSSKYPSQRQFSFKNSSSNLLQQNSLLKQQLSQLSRQLQQERQSKANLRNQLQIIASKCKQLQNKSSKSLENQLYYVEELQKLKGLVKRLNEEKQRLQFSQTATEREQIKDRIIMKLEDQLITTKLMLQSEKRKKIQKQQIWLNNTNKSPLKQIQTNRGLGSTYLRNSHYPEADYYPQQPKINFNKATYRPF